MEKHRTVVRLPQILEQRLKSLSVKTGKSVNSLIIDSCIDYLKYFEEKYGEIFKEDKNHEQ